MYDKLIKLANHLDQIGLHDEASEIDQILHSLAEDKQCACGPDEACDMCSMADDEPRDPGPKEEELPEDWSEQDTPPKVELSPKPESKLP